MIYIGIDPGKSGGYADIQDSRFETFPWDDAQFISHMRKLVDTGDGLMACLEKVGAMPGQGVTSMFNFGKSAGFIEGVLTALDVPYQLVMPKRWKGEFTLNGKDKLASVQTCRRLFPGANLRPTGRCRKDSDGMAEALLMAEFARRKL